MKDILNWWFDQNGYVFILVYIVLALIWGIWLGYNTQKKDGAVWWPVYVIGILSLTVAVGNAYHFITTPYGALSGLGYALHGLLALLVAFGYLILFIWTIINSLSNKSGK